MSIFARLKKWSLFEGKPVGGRFVVERPVDYLVIGERGVPDTVFHIFPTRNVSQTSCPEGKCWRVSMFPQTAMEPDFAVTLY